MLRVGVVCAVLLVIVGCSSSGSKVSTFAPAPQWSRSGADNVNSRIGPGFLDEGATLQWSVDLGAAIKTTPAVGPAGTVYVGTDEGRVVAVSPDGTTKWAFTDGDRLEAVGVSVAVDLNDITYFGTGDGFVFALDASGNEVWRFNAGSAVTSSPLLEVDSVDEKTSALFVTTEDGRLLAIGGEEGELRWEYDTGAAVHAEAAADAEGRLYVTADDGVLHAVTFAGSLLFRLPLGEVENPLTAPPSVAGGTIFQPGLRLEGGGGLAAVTLAGTKRWSFVAASPLPVPVGQSAASSAPTQINQLVVVDEGGTVYLVDQDTGLSAGTCVGGEADGKPCWSADNCPEGTCTGQAFFALHETVVAAPAVGANGSVVLATAPLDGGPATVRAIIPKVCFGGDVAGNPCRDNSDCEAERPGECSPGDGETESTAAVLWTFSNQRCSGGDQDGLPCSSAEDCTGDPPGECEAQLGPVRSGAAIANGGMVYFGSEDHHLYAIGLSTS